MKSSATYHNADAEFSDVIVYLGSATGVASTGAFGDWPGVVALDENADGYADAAITYQATPTQTQVAVFNGSALGIHAPASVTQSLLGNAADIGTNLTTDVNGDGDADLLTVSHVDPLRNVDVWYLPGGAAGPGTPVDLSLTSAIIGLDIGTIGDINGDGFGDLLAAIETMPTRYLAQFNGTVSGPATASSATLTWPNNMSTSTRPCS